MERKGKESKTIDERKVLDLISHSISSYQIRLVLHTYFPNSYLYALVAIVLLIVFVLVLVVEVVFMLFTYCLSPSTLMLVVLYMKQEC